MPIVIFGPVANFGHHPLGNVGRFKNFFTEIRKDPDACNYYAPNQARCQRVFVNIEALIKTPGWMKIDLQTIMPELSNFFSR